MAGTFSSNLMVNLEHLSLPEIFKCRIYDSTPAHMMLTPCHYNIIFGHDACRLFGITIDFNDNDMCIDGITINMHPTPKPNTIHHDDPSLSFAESLFIDTFEHDLFHNDNTFVSDQEIGNNDDTAKYVHKNKAITINTYEGKEIGHLMCQCSHLTHKQQQGLKELLNKHPTLFAGVLQEFPNLHIKLDIDPHIPTSAVHPDSVPT